LQKPSVYPWHVLFFALFPVIGLLANNTGQVNYAVAYRPLALTIIISALLLLIAKWLLHDWQKAGLLVTLLSALFFSYGHVYSYFEDAEVAGLLVGRHRVLVVLWLGLLVLAALWIAKRRDLRILTSSLNAITIFLLVFPLYTLISFWYSNLDTHVTKLSKDPYLDSPTPLQASPDSPDVYFFVLDQYARSDILTEYFEYDNSAFLNGLRELGFYVAACSQSNYPNTNYSLTATLNYDYVSSLGEDFAPGNTSLNPIHQALWNNRVKDTFRQLGYQVIAFETGYNFTELEDADIFYKLSSNKISNFEALLLRNSAMLVPADFGLLDQYYLSDDDRKRERIRFVLDRLEDIPSLPGRKFVFVHLAMPHPPFVFGPNGEAEVIPPYYENGEAGYRKADFRRGYRNQVVFISTEMLDVLKKILANSSQTPVIIVQGDHGTVTIPNEKRMSILNAYLFPDAQPPLHPRISPVNNFRLVFNTYFNGSLPLLPDQSFAYYRIQPFVFREVKNPCVSPE